MFLSIIRSFSLYTQQWYMSYRFSDSLRVGSCSQAVSKPVWHIPLLCVQWKTPDDGERNCPKHVEFYSKNKFEELVHIVGFLITIYHDARSPERQNRFCYMPEHAQVMRQQARTDWCCLFWFKQCFWYCSTFLSALHLFMSTGFIATWPTGKTLVGVSGTFLSYPYTVKFGVPHGSTFGKGKHYHVTCHFRYRGVGEWLWLYPF